MTAEVAPPVEELSYNQKYGYGCPMFAIDVPWNDPDDLSPIYLGSTLLFEDKETVTEVVCLDKEDYQGKKASALGYNKMFDRFSSWMSSFDEKIGPSMDPTTEIDLQSCFNKLDALMKLWGRERGVKRARNSSLVERVLDTGEVRMAGLTEAMFLEGRAKILGSSHQFSVMNLQRKNGEHALMVMRVGENLWWDSGVTIPKGRGNGFCVDQDQPLVFSCNRGVLTCYRISVEEKRAYKTWELGVDGMKMDEEDYRDRVANISSGSGYVVIDTLDNSVFVIERESAKTMAKLAFSGIITELRISACYIFIGGMSNVFSLYIPTLANGVFLCRHHGYLSDFESSSSKEKVKVQSDMVRLTSMCGTRIAVAIANSVIMKEMEPEYPFTRVLTGRKCVAMEHIGDYLCLLFQVVASNLSFEMYDFTSAAPVYTYTFTAECTESLFGLDSYISGNARMIQILLGDGTKTVLEIKDMPKLLFSRAKKAPPPEEKKE